MSSEKNRPGETGGETDILDRLKRLLNGETQECLLRLTFQEEAHRKSDKDCCKFTLEQARKYANLTQAALAKGLGVDRSTYIKIEKDVSRATVGQIYQIAQITGVPASDIFLSAEPAEVEAAGE